MVLRVIIFYYLRAVKQKAMKRSIIKNIVFAGCKKTPVAVLAPVCYGIDINFV